MVKNYISTGILLIGLLFSFNYSYSQAVTFTGHPSDFPESQRITGGDGVDYYVSFSATTMYFGAFRTDGGTFTDNDQFTIYFDTDPQPSINTGDGSIIGLSAYAGTPVPTLPFNADRRFTISNTGSTGTTTHNSYGTAWGPASGAFPNRKTSSTALEIAIPFTRLNPNQFTITQGVYFSMFIARNQPNNAFYGYSHSGYPISFDGNISTGFFGGIGITSGVTNPTAHTNTPILHFLLNQNPVPGAKYAYIETDANGDFYTVTGDIELVEGGSASIGAGTALTINGTFTNNGLVTLNSNSESYSSLIATTIDGDGYAQYYRYVNQNSTTGDNDLVSTPLTGQTFGAFAADNEGRLLDNGSQRAFGIFNKDSAKYKNYYTDRDGGVILELGVGYRAAAIPDMEDSEFGTTFIYTGDINTGEVSTPIRNTATAFSDWNLIGNPYPSYIKARDLLLANTGVLVTASHSLYGYKGNNDKNDYKVWETIGMGGAFSERVIAPGQGFFVLSNATGGDLTFTPAMRVASNADDFIEGRMAPIDLAGLRLRIATETKSFYTDIYFENGPTLDFDPGYDIQLLDVPSFSVFSKLVEDVNNVNLQLDIQTLPYDILDTEVSVPIGIKAIQGEEITISATNMTPTAFPLPENVEVYLDDVEAQTSTFLSTSTFDHNDRYVFTPSENLTGETGRFFLRFTNKSLSVSNPDFNALNVYSPLNTGNLIVRGTVNEVTSLEVYDLNGRLLQTFSVQPNQAINRFEVSNLATGIYIVKLNNKAQTKVKKIQLSNRL